MKGKILITAPPNILLSISLKKDKRLIKKCIKTTYL
jgi:hypothetical protein